MRNSRSADHHPEAIRQNRNTAGYQYARRGRHHRDRVMARSRIRANHPDLPARRSQAERASAEPDHPADQQPRPLPAPRPAVGDNPDRMRSEAAFAHLCGVAPISASSGKTHRHRLNRGGDRAANNALYTVVLARLRSTSAPAPTPPAAPPRACPAARSSAACSAPSPASSTTPWSQRPRPRRPGRLIDGNGWVNPETPKARTAGLKHPLPSMTIPGRRGHLAAP